MLYCLYLIHRTVNCNCAKVDYRPSINGVLVTYNVLTFMQSEFVNRYRLIVTVHIDFINASAT